MVTDSHGAVVLFSGGQDSTTCLYWAKERFGKIRAVSIRYGQRHASELKAASDVCSLAGVPHDILDCPALSQVADSDLVRSGTEIKSSGGYADSEAVGGLPSSFVPGRNVILLTLAVAVAVRHGFKDVVSGVCQTDYSGYPDCRRPFVDSLERTLSLGMPSSCGPVRIHAPLMYLTKAETVEMARGLEGCWEALGRTVTCYEGMRPGCGSCPSCELRRRGFEQAGYTDPAFG